MTRPDNVYCFFEQSGTFKRAFAEFGIHAEDYDIQNNFGETDHVIDLFAEIEKGYDGKPSVFDRIVCGDLRKPSTTKVAQQGDLFILS